jgi:hypothetical protein
MSYTNDMRNVWSNKEAKLASMSPVESRERWKRIKEAANHKSIKEYPKK